MSRGTTTTEPGPGASPAPLPATVGRYRIVDVLGAGGMGSVYAAHDPELDRAVAIKVLHARGAASRQEPLRREAQVMARLAHPNLVRVYDVGVEDGRLFVAMELVDGQTLRAWLLERERGWRDALVPFLAAARGLAAAHHAGIVHLDFKPDNVLLDRDGSVRVSDFGLARDAARDGDDDDDVPTGGTPAYMAPEQHLGRALDARADQFAFCVALHEAIYRAHPFAPSGALDTVDAYGVEVIAGRVRVPPSGLAPRWLWKVVRRGLETEAAARFPTMDALIAAIERRLTLPRRAGITAGFVAVAAIAGGVAFAASPREGHASCAVPAERLAVWDDAARARARAAFAATDLAFAADAFAGVDVRLTAARDDWDDASVDACQARARGGESVDLGDRRAACLDRAWHRIGDLSARFGATLDRDTVEHAVSAAVAVAGDVARCSDLEALLQRPGLPEDPAVRQRLAELEARLAVARTDADLGHHARGAATAAAIIEEARALGYPPLLARALYETGSAQERAGEYDAARALQLEASGMALAAGDDELAARSLAELLWVVGVDQDDAGAAQLLLGLAPAAAQRAPVDVQLQTRRMEAKVLISLTRYDEAIAILRDLLAIHEQRDPASLEVAVTATTLGEVLEITGAYGEARAQEERALALFEAALGPKHPHVAIVLNNLGMLVQSLSDWQGSAAYLERALAIKQAINPPGAPTIAVALHNLAIVRYETGDLVTARRLYEQAIAIREDKLGPDHPLLATSLGGLAMTARQEGHLDEASALLARALAIKEKAKGPEDPSVAYTLLGMARVEMARGDADRARAHAERALAIRRKALGERHPDVGEPLLVLAELDLSSRNWADAERRATEAAALYEAALGPSAPEVIAARELVATARAR